MVTEKKVFTACKKRCKQCNTEGDKALCKGCKLDKNKEEVSKRRAISYCKECRNGNSFDICNSPECPLFSLMPDLIKETAMRLQGK